MKAYKIFKCKNGQLTSINDWLPPALHTVYKTDEPNVLTDGTKYLVFRDLDKCLEWIGEWAAHDLYDYEVWEVEAYRPVEIKTVAALRDVGPTRDSPEFLAALRGWWGQPAAKRTNALGTVLYTTPYSPLRRVIRTARPPDGTYGTTKVSLVKRVAVL